ncbi:MAG: FG-GAP repeat domain-containing protein, partial [Candidatus Hodarchaeota archaeon]
EVNWFENNGSGNFSKKDIDTQTLEPGYVHCSDINNDGFIDIIGMSFLSKQLYWWQHKEENSFTRHIISESYGGTICKTADIDSDGDMDIFASDYINGFLYWWENLLI